jgi:SAM-dependent methyltransferase
LTQDPGKPAGDFDYDQPGLRYGAMRQADPRIEEQIRAALGEARTVLNVGAGSGNYEPADRTVVALEPSASQRAQRPAGAAPCVIGTAEALPFDDKSFDAVMASLTIHQWPDLERGLAELKRVARRRIVILTFDPGRIASFWFYGYLPPRANAERKRMPEFSRLAALLGPDTSFEAVPVPFDCTDGFNEAFYGRPERFLDPAVRAAQSLWSFLGPDLEADIVHRLTADLDSGAWDAAHGHLRTQPTFDGSLRLVVTRL